MDRQLRDEGGRRTSAVREYRSILVAILASRRLRKRIGRACRSTDIRKCDSAIGTHLPLNGGSRVGGGSRRERDRTSDRNRLAGRISYDDRRKQDRQRGGRRRHGTDRVCEDRSIFDAVLTGRLARK